jgi:1-acyl-sn-glycerol-3-phosphate acyltransferase
MIAALVAGVARSIAGGYVRWLSPPDPRQRVYYANHTSHLDFALIWSYLPPRTRRLARPVAARDYWERGPLRRFFAVRIFNAILIDREPAPGEELPPGELGRRAVARMVEGLGDSHSLIVFPEGTRGSGGAVAPFKSGLYHLCRAKPELELVPVYVENLNRVLPKGEFIPVPMVSRITFGQPTRLGADESKDAFLGRAREAVESLRES